jgi:hypothetical protein
MSTVEVFPPKQLADWWKASARLAGVKILFGARERADGSSSRRVVVTPVGGPLMPPQDTDNLTDAQIAVRCEAWGASYDDAWAIVKALVNAAYDFRTTKNIDTQHAELELGTEPDTNQDGYSATVTFILRAPIEQTPLPADAGVGEVDAIQFQDQQGNVTGTLPLP